MKIEFIQKIIDKIRGKDISVLKLNLNNLKNKLSNIEYNYSNFIASKERIDGFINGSENEILCISGSTSDKITFKYKAYSFKIKGDNNKIYFYNSNGINNCIPSGLNITIYGNNNILKIYDSSFCNSKIYIEKNDNTFILEKPVKCIEGAYFCVERGATIHIQKNCELGNGKLRMFANGDYKNKHKIVVGEGTFIAHDAIIRNSDGECLIDYNSHAPLSEPKNIIIGKNCWITSRCTILKGVNLPNGTIVGACSLVNKKFEKENTLIAGTPARIIKENVAWVPYSYGEYMEKINNDFVY